MNADWNRHKVNCAKVEVDAVAECFANHNWGYCGLPGSLILLKRLKRKGIPYTLKYGYLRYPGDKMVQRHVWIENAAKVRFDIARATVAKLTPDEENPEAGDCEILTRVSKDTPKNMDEVVDLHGVEIFFSELRDGKMPEETWYWKNAPLALLEIYQELLGVPAFDKPVQNSGSPKG